MTSGRKWSVVPRSSSAEPDSACEGDRMSRQWWDWHLTPTGWREGQYLGDFGRTVGNAMPRHTVLTVRQYADTSSGHLQEYSEETRHGSEAAIRHLQEKYGN